MKPKLQVKVILFLRLRSLAVEVQVIFLPQAVEHNLITACKQLFQTPSIFGVMCIN